MENTVFKSFIGKKIELIRTTALVRLHKMEPTRLLIVEAADGPF
jgi:hypothetical protein